MVDFLMGVIFIFAGIWGVPWMAKRPGDEDIGPRGRWIMALIGAGFGGVMVFFGASAASWCTLAGECSDGGTSWLGLQLNGYIPLALIIIVTALGVRHIYRSIDQH